MGTMQNKILEQFLQVKLVSTDTRNIREKSIFFCLKGANFNGNKFIDQALALGASMVVSDEDFHTLDKRVFRVNNALGALQKLALDYRRIFQIPFLAITGSNGKTTTKELIRDVLKKKYKVHATEGNLNNHIGIPLTILSMPTDCEFAIIEMGANHQKEISDYCQFVEPNIGLVTNMGKAHLEGFGGIEGVRKGKKELYDYLHSKQRQMLVNTELENLNEATMGMNRIEYGFHSGNFKLELISESPNVVYAYSSSDFHVQINTQLAGGYNLYNIASAVAVAKFFGVEDEKIHEAIAQYRPENNRSQIMKTTNNTLILDAYNANPSSMEHALMSLSNQNAKDKYFIIGDMRELGDSSIEEHKIILSKATELGLIGITIGEFFKSIESEFSFQSFLNKDEAKVFLQENILRDKLILVKGSRGIQLEDIVPML